MGASPLPAFLYVAGHCDVTCLSKGPDAAAAAAAEVWALQCALMEVVSQTSTMSTVYMNYDGNVSLSNTPYDE